MTIRPCACEKVSLGAHSCRALSAGRLIIITLIVSASVGLCLLKVEVPPDDRRLNGMRRDSRGFVVALLTERA